MSQTASQQEEEVVRDFLLIADLLKQTHLARIHAYLYREGEATVGEIIDELDFTQGSAYTYVNQLTDAGVLTPTTDTQPQRYAAVEIELTLTVDGDREYTISPALVAAVARRATDDTSIRISIVMESTASQPHSPTLSLVSTVRQPIDS